MADMPGIDAVYTHLWNAAGESSLPPLDRSLGPRPRDSLYDVAERYGLSEGLRVLDVGSGPGSQSCALARRFGCSVVGVDPVQSNLKEARIRAFLEDLMGRVRFVDGTIDALPFDDDAFDAVWCRDMLCHVEDLTGGMRECARVLKPGGVMIVLATVATDLMEPREAAAIYGPLAVASGSMDRAAIERAFDGAGLEVVWSENLHAEYLEYEEERTGHCARELLRLARMMRAREQLVEEIGEAAYEVALAFYRWEIAKLLGKIDTMVYVLRGG